jgi:hypothetical protein
MPVLSFNHLNVRTPDFGRTVNFLRDALGMKVSPVPDHDSIETFRIWSPVVEDFLRPLGL